MTAAAAAGVRHDYWIIMAYTECRRDNTSMGHPRRASSGEIEKYTQIPTVSSEKARSTTRSRRLPFVVLWPPWPFPGPLLLQYSPPRRVYVRLIVVKYFYSPAVCSEPPSSPARRENCCTRRLPFVVVLPLWRIPRHLLPVHPPP